jgi:hypothetical protein
MFDSPREITLDSKEDKALFILWVSGRLPVEVQQPTGVWSPLSHGICQLWINAIRTHSRLVEQDRARRFRLAPRTPS